MTMHRFDNVLFPTDFSHCANHTAGNALAFAARCRSELTMLHASLLYENHPQQGRFETVEPEPDIRKQMSAHIDAHGSHGLNVKQVEVRGLTAAQCIVEYAERDKSDLIIIGTHGRTGFKRWLLGSVAEEVVRTAPCPVLSLKESWEDHSLADIRNILVPIDFSLASRTALHKARQMASLFGARLWLLHVIQPPPYPDVYTFSSVDDFYGEATMKSVEVMESLLAEEGPEVKATIHVETGHPAQQILQFIETHTTDLILMAHLGISRLPGRVLGSVTEHVVRAAKCPVLTADLGQE
jgi:nucleotide-binding universal stress UspA family protein